jgi:LysR family transcriptional regulator, glycine cleavage system transcriptional activator
MAQDIRFPSIDGLRAFEASARLGSFERAADELAIGASAVAKRVATVEELLGNPLFQRQAKALQLTPAGREYLPQVKGALQLLAAMPQHRRTAQRRERLRVLAPPTFARQILVPRLDSFAIAHAQVELELQLSVPYAEPVAVQADVEVRYGEVDAATADVLLREQVLPLAAPSLLARLPLRQPADLARAPLLRTPLQPWVPWFRAAGLDWPEPSEGPKLLDLGLTLEAAVAGQGVVLARPALARPWLAAGSLLPSLPQRAWPTQHYQLLTHASSEAARGFAQWLRLLCERELAEAREELSRRL